MSNDDWIATRIAEARECCVDICEGVSAIVDKLLRGELAEGPLTSKELAKISGELIAAMGQIPPKAEAK